MPCLSLRQLDLSFSGMRWEFTYPGLVGGGKDLNLLFGVVEFAGLRPRLEVEDSIVDEVVFAASLLFVADSHPKVEVEEPMLS